MNSGEIIGGTTAPNHSLPYMALIKYYKEKRTPYQCGGFRVKNDIITTAASCKGSNMTVTLGVHDIDKKKKSSPNTIRVLKPIHHEKYDKEKKVNDIMLLKFLRSGRSVHSCWNLPSSAFCKAGFVDRYCSNLVLSWNVLFTPSMCILYIGDSVFHLLYSIGYACICIS
ncbi:hypothetical protein STEG23_021985 [Scotinomys teguina]